MTEQLIHYTRTGNFEKVKKLIEDGARVNYQDKWGDTALTSASYYGHLEIVEFLIEKGAKKDLQNNDGYAALMLASYNGHLEIVEFLIEKGANLHLQNKYGRTALDIAIEKNHQEIVEILTKKNKVFYQKLIIDRETNNLINLEDFDLIDDASDNRILIKLKKSNIILNFVGFDNLIFNIKSNNIISAGNNCRFFAESDNQFIVGNNCRFTIDDDNLVMAGKRVSVSCLRNCTIIAGDNSTIDTMEKEKTITILGDNSIIY